MIAAWVKALLFVGGGVTAAAGTAYVTGLMDPWLATPPQTLAALPETPETAPQEQAPPAAAAVPQPEEPQTTPKQGRLQPPSFDLLRVEPDGSVVIAGKATPDVSIEVLNGEAVIAKTTSTPDGDFVAVLDVPLAPGDYQLALRATLGDEIAMSDATAIVSIPETPQGEVLAMVEEPGKPAEIITAPEAPAAPADGLPADAAPAEGDDDVAAAPDQEPAAPAGEEVAAEAPEAPADVVAEEEQPAEEDVAAAPAEDPATTPDEQAPAEEDVAADEPAPAETEVAAAPAEDPASTEEQAAPEENVAAEEDAPAEQESAAQPAEEAQPAAPAEPAVESVVVVEAVEIEGGTVFVAGSATPGRTVRVYANALHLGDSKASDGGRFLIEAKRDLPVGDYVIRADLLEADGTVIARAAVPFEREPGESIAAVAPPATPQPAAPDAPAEDADVAAAPTDPAPAEDDVADAPMEDAAVEDDVAEAPAPAEDEVAAAPAQPSEEDAAAPAETPVEADVAAAPAEGQPADASEQPADAAGQPTEEPEIEVAAAPPAADEAELTAPKLQKVDGAVIIRRGDNLWRISRRVYGMGVRYSTIYLANQDQITDPDRIWPGQVFSVPQETVEGEAADLEAMGDQIVPPETESKIIR
jgi:nucleoid-associated protein YgaU